MNKLKNFFAALDKIFSSRQFNELAQILFKLRFAIATIIFLLCILLELHGSSISLYANFLSHPELDINWLGVSRRIRSDEWLVFTPFAFSQYFTDFSMISDLIRGTATNVFIIYGQAVHHLAMIFRPAQLGYLFLDQGSSLAFFWAGRLIVLFMMSFEFARKVLDAKKSLSLLYAVMITFSPLAQWWWSVNSIAELLTAGQGLVLFWKLYLNRNDTKRFIFAAGMLWCAGIFILGIYPAWQVSFGWTFLLCLIAVTSRDALGILRRDKIFWLVGLVLVIAPIAHAILSSMDVIKLTTATEYPGSRFELGGNISPLHQMFYVSDSLLPFCDISQPKGVNNSEMATFFSMAPLGLIVFVIATIRRNAFDLLMTLLVVLSGVFMLWETFGFPAWLAKITLMSNVTFNRARTVTDFLQMLILFRGLSLIDLNLSRRTKLFLAGAISIGGTLATCDFLGGWIGIKKILVMLGFAGVTVYLITSRLTNLRIGLLIVMMLLIGGTVNPVARGVDCVYKVPVGQKIADLARADKSLWLVEDDDVALNDFPIMFGAPTINSVNIYPALDRWQKLDPTGANRSVYNRYAHISIVLTDAPTEFQLNQVDYFTLNLNPADLPKLDVRYIFSRNATLEKFSTRRVKIKKLYEESGSYIYSVAYAT